MRRVSAVLAVVLLAALAPTAAAAAGGLSQQSVDADVVVMTADVTASGDAMWTIDYRVRLADDNETQAFEELQAEIRTNESVYADRFRDRLNRTARAGTNATGREMAIENVSVETSRENVGQSYGVVSYAFRWTNFATSNDTHIRAGDAIAGLYLDRNTSLTVRWPVEYRRVGVRPSPDGETDRSVTWQGRQSFADDEPTVVTEKYPPFSDALGQQSPIVSFAAPLLALAVLAAAGYAVYRYVRTDETSEMVAGATASSESDSDGPPTDDGGSENTDTPPAELLSNEEQVLKLLRENGGRIKQQRVASDLDWSAAKTSQVIGNLRDEGELETFRIGRENVVTLPETDVTGDTEPPADGDK